MGYLLDNEGNVVVTPYGECVRSGSWSIEAARPSCDESLRKNARADYQIRKIIESSSSQTENIIEVMQGVIDDLKAERGVVAQETERPSSDSAFCDQDYIPDDEDGKHQYRVAVALLAGLCEPEVNLKSEVKMLLKEAISYENTAAMNVYGYLLIDGSLFGYQDTEYGVEYFQKAAANNDADALYNLGFVYEYGVGVAADVDESNRYYARSDGASSSLFRLKQHGGNVEEHMDRVKDLVEDEKAKDSVGSNSDSFEEMDEKSDPPFGDVKEEAPTLDDRFAFPYIKN